jgi:hypothetical protein
MDINLRGKTTLIRGLARLARHHNLQSAKGYLQPQTHLSMILQRHLAVKADSAFFSGVQYGHWSARVDRFFPASKSAQIGCSRAPTPIFPATVP